MGLFDRFKKKAEIVEPVTPVELVKVKKPRQSKKKVVPVTDKLYELNQTEKANATANGDPWVTVIKVNLDSTNLNNGNFELDYNDIFVAKLIRAGYSGKHDYDIVDHWFTDVCRNVVLETFDQEMADPEKRATFEQNKPTKV